MEINISDEIIEEMIKEQVKNRVNQYIASRTKDDPHWIQELFRNCAIYEVRRVITDEFARETCKELCNDQIVHSVANILADKMLEGLRY